MPKRPQDIRFSRCIFCIVLAVSIPSRGNIGYDRLVPVPQRCLYGSPGDGLDLPSGGFSEVAFTPNAAGSVAAMVEQIAVSQGRPTLKPQTHLQQQGRFCALLKHDPGWPGPAIWPQAPQSPQGYAMEITPGGVALAADGDAGFFYGVQTLTQLVRQSRQAGEPISAGVIVDWPDVSSRAVLMNVQELRENSQIDGLLKILTALAGLKYTDIFLEFNSAIPGPHSAFAQTVPNPLRTDQIRAIVRHAEKQHLTVNLSFQFGGHCRWLLREPSYAEFGEVPKDKLTWDNANWCPLHPGLWPVIEDLVRHQMDLCRPKRVLVAHDELYHGEFGVCPRCRKSGLSHEQLIATSLKELRRIIPASQARLLVWHDLFQPDTLKSALDSGFARSEQLFALSPDDLEMCIWDYSGSSRHIPTIDFFQKRRRNFWVSTFQAPDARNVCYYAERYRAQGVLSTHWFQAASCRWDGPRELSARAITQVVAAAAYSWNVGQTSIYQNGDPVQAFRQLVDPAVDPPASTVYDTMGLTKAGNASLSTASRIGRMGEMVHSLPREVFNGKIPFRISDTFICLAGENTDSASLARRVVIPIARPVQAIHFLHCCDLPTAGLNDWSQAMARPVIGHYRLKFDSGQTVEIPLEYRWNIQDWNSLEGAWDAPVAWQGTLPKGNARANIQCYSWRNTAKAPARLTAIEFSTTAQRGLKPMLLALTVETGNPSTASPTASQPIDAFENILFRETFDRGSAGALTDRWNNVTVPEAFLAKAGNRIGTAQITLPPGQKSRCDVSPKDFRMDLSAANAISMSIRPPSTTAGTFVCLVYLGNRKAGYYYRLGVPDMTADRWNRVVIPLDSASTEGPVPSAGGLKTIDTFMISFFHTNHQPIHLLIDDVVIGRRADSGLLNQAR